MLYMKVIKPRQLANEGGNRERVICVSLKEEKTGPRAS